MTLEPEEDYLPLSSLNHLLLCPRCRGCSLIGLCFPDLSEKPRRVHQYLRTLYEPLPPSKGDTT